MPYANNAIGSEMHQALYPIESTMNDHYRSQYVLRFAGTEMRMVRMTPIQNKSLFAGSIYKIEPA